MIWKNYYLFGGVEVDHATIQRWVYKFTPLIEKTFRKGTKAIGNRINFRKGRVSAISTTARRLAVIIWNMVVNKQPYNNEHGYEFLDEKHKRKVQKIKKTIYKFDVKTDESGLQLNCL